jgi:UDP-4-amino-4-deoxy-L-arabinose formyltransferase/UDP-glucuronic acid dehydrogenase (UDP-4-keto-hexauronic acid decarboxylating)
VTRVVLFSYGPMIGAVRSFFAGVGTEAAAHVLPSNRPPEALAGARADGAGIPQLVQPPRAEAEEFAERLRALEPDIFLVWHYSMLLPPAVLRVPPRGAVNLHGGLLPDYRGPHVLQWAIANGERETGMTLHYLDEGFDTGPVVAEARVPIDDCADAATVAAALQAVGLELLREHWAALASGTASARPQPPGGRYWPRRSAADGEIDWREPAASIRNLVRALVPPWPGAMTRAGSLELVIDRVDVVDGVGEPGTVVEARGGRVVVAAGQGAVVLRAARRGGEPVPLDQLGLRPGDRLG